MDLNLEYFDIESLKRFSKEVLIERFIQLQQNNIELKENNKQIIKIINEYSLIKTEIKKHEELKTLIAELYDPILKIMKFYSKRDTENNNRGKGYSLLKVPNKKYGFLYYVRYIVDGKIISSRWSTYTNDLEAAKLFAVDNKSRILEEYNSNKLHLNYHGNSYKLLK
jgi:hypothetical protein